MFRRALAFIAASLGWAPGITAQVVHDGTLGPAGPLPGPNFLIDPARGRLVGSNLFHSFQSFNIAMGESATFTGPGSVSNVLARVTGGGASSINGTLRCAIPQANLYLINPSGVVFGPGASLDVGGSFAVTTADVAELSDAGRFDARTPANSVLTSAPPAAFGFLGTSPASIELTGMQSVRTRLDVRPGESLSVIAGDVRMQDARLRAADGRVCVVSLSGPGRVAFDPAHVGGPITVEPPAGGDLTMQRLAEINSDGAGGGRIVLRAGRIFMAQPKAIITAGARGDAGGLGMDIQASQSLKMLGRSTILAVAAGAGDGGDIEVRAPLVVLDGKGVPDDVFGLSTAATGSGRGGDVFITADTVRIRDASKISSETFGPGGRGGNIAIAAGRIVIDATNDPNNATTFTGLASRTKNITDAGGSFIAENPGRAGDIVIDCDTLRLAKGGKIAADTLGAGAAGVVSVRAREVLMKGALPGLSSGISAEARPGSTGRGGRVVMEIVDSLLMSDKASIGVNTFGEGNGGDLSIVAGTLSLSGAARLSADARASADGGNIGIRARAIALDGSIGEEGFTGITADTRRTFLGGDGGNILLETLDLTIRGGAAVSTSTFGDGISGNIVVAGPRGSVLLDGLDGRGFTGLAAQSLSPEPGAGRGGSVQITTGNLQLFRGAAVSANTFGPAQGGSARVFADTVRLDSGGVLRPTTITASSRGQRAVTDVDVALDITHTFDADLNVTLTNPAGTRVALFAGVGGAGENFRGTTLDDEAAQAIGDGAAPFIGRFRPAGRLSSFDGQDANGAWQLRIVDSGPGDSGRLESWSLRFEDRGFRSADVPALIDDLSTVRSDLPVKLVSASPIGPGGSVRIETGDLFVLRGAKVSAVTVGEGRGGDVTVIASRNVRLDDQGFAPAFTGVVADTESTEPTAGRGGSITVRAGELLDIREFAGITANSLGAGTAGSVDVSAGRLHLSGGGIIGVSAPGSTAGNIVARSETSMQIERSLITAVSGGRGGNIKLKAPGTVQLNSSTITAQAGASGANAEISIDPRFVILNASIINGKAKGVDVQVDIDARALILSSDSEIRTDRRAFSIDDEIASSMVALTTDVRDASARLQDICGRLFEEGDVSSFFVIGRRGRPLEPPGQLPSGTGR